MKETFIVRIYLQQNISFLMHFNQQVTAFALMLRYYNYTTFGNTWEFD